MRRAPRWIGTTPATTATIMDRLPRVPPAAPDSTTTTCLQTQGENMLMARMRGQLSSMHSSNKENSMQCAERSL